MKSLYLLLLFFSACALQTQECPSGFMPAKQTVVTPSGVVTQPNEYGQLPPGTLRVGNNICIRKTGVIEPRPAFTDLSQVGTGATGVTGVVKLWPLAADKILAMVRFGSSYTLRAAYTDGTEAGLSGFGNGFSPGKIQLTHTRDRTIVAQGDLAPQVIADSDLGSTGGSTKTSRKAGLPMPSYIAIDAGFEGGAVLSDQNYTSYRAVFRRTIGGYTFQGAVSAAYAAKNTSGATSNPLVTIYWTAETPVEAGDQIEVYRVEQKDNIDLLDDRYRYAFSYTLTSSDISARFASLVDSAVSTSDDLYYDSSQEGAAKNNYMPPPSTDVVTFKGATFYAASSAWHARSLRAKYKWGAMSGADGISHTVGSVIKTVSYTSGSANLSAASVTGLVVGMRINSAAFPNPTRILSITGSGPFTITASANATSTSGSASVTFDDAIEINGVYLDAATPGTFALNVALANIAGTVPVVALPDLPLITIDQSRVTFTLIEPVSGTAAFTIRATHGDRYTPPLPEFTATVETSTNDPRTNRLYFSKIGQPEAVSPDNFLFVRHGTLLKMWATEESLFVACTDGISRIIGDGDDWAETPFNEDTILLTPDAVDTMDNTAFALTTAGFVSITESGVQKISSPLVGDDFRALWKQFQGFTPSLPFTWGIQVAADKYRNEVWINFNNLGASGTPAFISTYIWNTETNTFTTQSTEQSIGVAYIPFLQSIVLGQPLVSALKLQLRKYSDTDYMTANFEFNPVFGEDVGYLKQWIDVTLLFQLLQAVTIKPAFERVDYPAAYTLTAGDNVEEVCAVLQDYAYNKHCRFGATITPVLASKHWTLLGLTYRYRLASETLRS